MSRISTIKPALYCLVLAVGALGQSATPDSATQERLLVLEHLWNEAQVNRDWRALEGMISERFINTEYDGQVSDRDKFLADIKDPEFKPTAVTIRDVRVNVYHETAIVTGIYQTKGTYSGKAYQHLGRFTDSWILEDGRWLCVASHTSLLKK